MRRPQLSKPASRDESKGGVRPASVSVGVLVRPARRTNANPAIANRIAVGRASGMRASLC